MIPARVPPPPPGPLRLPKLLLVEGDTPMHFFEALLRHLGLADQVEIRSFRGVGDFRTFLRGIASTTEFRRLVTSLGVARDAEDRPAVDARQSVTAALTAVGLIPPPPPLQRTSVFILPDDTDPGMIETLCMEAVRAEPALAPAHGCVEDFFRCLTGRAVPLPGEPRLAKNRAQAYLATRPESQLFPGVAAYRGYWPWGSPAFVPLIQFLQAL